MTNGRTQILVSGWRWLPHSYAVLTQFICLELLRRPDVQLFFDDAPYYDPNWLRVDGLFSIAEEEAIAKIPALPDGVTPDKELRISFPYDLLTEPRARRTFVLGTAEYRAVPASYIAGNVPLAEALRRADHSLTITAMSEWSRQGFVRSGADPDRVAVVHLGVDPTLLHAPTETVRDAARAKYSIADDEFVFLSVGAMTGNKNMAMLLRSFAAVLRESPGAKLILKGTDALYYSKQLYMTTAMGALNAEEASIALPRIIYLGKSMDFSDIAQLYHASDCYVSPYIAEGFNLPVLEAAACGLPVICTAGGPTDDFTRDEFCRRIDSGEVLGEEDGVPTTSLRPDYMHLEKLMIGIVSDDDFRHQARQAGPAYVTENFTWRHTVDKLLEIS